MNTYIISNLRIGRELGSGAFGTTYLATDPVGKKYALKIEKTSKKSSEKSRYSQVWREIKFAQLFGSKYPDQFARLYDYSFDDHCEHEQKFPIGWKLFDEKTKDEFIKRNKSPHCSLKLYEYKEGMTLHKFDKKFGINQELRTSIMIQLILIVKIMKSHGWLHCDLHWGNIIMVPTQKSYIKIDNTRIKTHGYICCLIDYGQVLNKKHLLPKEKYFLNINEYCQVCLPLMYLNKIHDYAFKHSIESQPDLSKKGNYKMIFELLHKMFGFTNEFELGFAFEIVFPDEYNKSIYSSIEKKFPLELYFPLDHIYYVALNINNPDVLIEFLKGIVITGES